MTYFRPDWLERKIERQLARHKAIRTHPQGCDCDLCITQAQIDARIRKILMAQEERNGPPPF